MDVATGMGKNWPQRAMSADWFESRKQADQAIQEIGTVKQKRGYCRLPEKLFLF